MRRSRLALALAVAVVAATACTPIGIAADAAVGAAGLAVGALDALV